MVSRRNVFKLTASSLALFLAVTPALFFSTNSITNAQDSSDHDATSLRAVEIANKPQHIFAPRWTTEKDLYTVIYIRNVQLDRPTTATLSLQLPHRTVALPSLVLQPLETEQVDIRNALQQTGEPINQSGAAHIDFDAPSGGGIIAYAQVLSQSRSLSFSFPFMEAATSQVSPLQAVAWYYGDHTEAYISMQNTSAQDVSINASVVVEGQEKPIPPKKLKAGQFDTMKLPSPLALGNKNGAKSAGVVLRHNGQPGSVIAQGWVLDDDIGFSVPFTFHSGPAPNDAETSEHLLGTGVMIGNVDPMMGLPSDVIFSPYLALWNSSANPITAKTSFSYKRASRIETVALPATTLGAKSSVLLNLRDYQLQGLIPFDVSEGNIKLEYDAAEHALLAELTSVDQLGSFVTPVPLICDGRHSAHMVFWRTDGSWESSITLQNVAATKNDLEVTITWRGGQYLVETSIAPGDTAMVSINELQQSRQPDRAGNVIPPDAVLGGVKILSRNKDHGLIINSMLVNPVTRTCGSCNGQPYVTQYYLSDKAATGVTGMLEGFDAYLAGGSVFQLYINIGESDGTIFGTSSLTNVSSSNGSVATVTGSSVYTGNPGTTSITASTSDLYYTDSACSQAHRLTPPSETLTVAKLDITLNGTTITGTTRDVIVGQKISLAAAVQPSGTTINHPQWTIPGVRVANYVVQYTNPTSPTSGTRTELTDTSGTSIAFYWVDGADGRQVQFSCKIGGKPFTAIATFNVKRPTSQVTSVTGSTALNSTCTSGLLAVHFGCPTPSTPGIKFSRNVTIPSGFSGSFAWVQVINSTMRVRYKSDGSHPTLQGNNVLDTTFPYPDSDGSGGTEDSPAQPFVFDDNEITINDNFTMWLLFKPSFADSIWVPLRKVDWYWTADATQSSLISAGNTLNPSGFDTTDHPVWSGNVRNLTFQ